MINVVVGTRTAILWARPGHQIGCCTIGNVYANVSKLTTDTVITYQADLKIRTQVKDLLGSSSRTAIGINRVNGISTRKQIADDG